jgi:putative transposase
MNNAMILYRVNELRNRHQYTGARKLQKMLADPKYGLPVEIGRDRLFRLLRDNGMLSGLYKNYVPTSDSKHDLDLYPNLLKDLKPSSVNQAWVSDITYLRLPDKSYCYLFLTSDLFSRKIIGYALRESLEAEGAVDALQMAIRCAKPATGFIHHSDHGIQYCCSKYNKLVLKYGGQISMTGENHCYDNAVAERINGILKHEYGLGSTIASFAAAHRLATNGIKIYNAERLHVSLGYRTPDHVFYLFKHTA